MQPIKRLRNIEKYAENSDLVLNKIGCSFIEHLTP